MDPIHQSPLTKSTVLMIVDGCFVYFIRLNSLCIYISVAQVLYRFYLLEQDGVYSESVMGEKNERI